MCLNCGAGKKSVVHVLRLMINYTWETLHHSFIRIWSHHFSKYSNMYIPSHMPMAAMMIFERERDRKIFSFLLRMSEWNESNAELFCVKEDWVGRKCLEGMGSLNTKRILMPSMRNKIEGFSFINVDHTILLPLLWVLLMLMLLSCLCWYA